MGSHRKYAQAPGETFVLDIAYMPKDTTTQCNKFLVCVDQCTAYTTAVVLHDILRTTVNSAIQAIFSILPLPKVLITDFGNEFQDITQFCKDNNVMHLGGSPLVKNYSGSAENAILQLKTMLRKLTADFPDQWVSKLPLATLLLNSTLIHRQTQRKNLFLSPLYYQSLLTHLQPLHSIYEQKKLLEKVKQQRSEKLLKAATKLRHPQELFPNQIVLDYYPDKTGKNHIQQTATDIYRVLTLPTPVTARVQSLLSGTERTFPVNHLKPLKFTDHSLFAHLLSNHTLLQGADRLFTSNIHKVKSQINREIEEARQDLKDLHKKLNKHLQNTPTPHMPNDQQQQQQQKTTTSDIPDSTTPIPGLKPTKKPIREKWVLPKPKQPNLDPHQQPCSPSPQVLPTTELTDNNQTTDDQQKSEVLLLKHSVLNVPTSFFTCGATPHIPPELDDQIIANIQAFQLHKQVCPHCSHISLRVKDNPINKAPKSIRIKQWNEYYPSDPSPRTSTITFSPETNLEDKTPLFRCLLAYFKDSITSSSEIQLLLHKNPFLPKVHESSPPHIHSYIIYSNDQHPSPVYEEQH